MISTNPTGRLLIGLLNTDRAFIVDTLGLLLNKWGIKAQFILHPILAVRRDPQGKLESICATEEKDTQTLHESLILVQAKNRLTSQQIQDFVSELEESMKRLQMVMDDSVQLKESLQEPMHALSAQASTPAIQQQYHDFVDWLSQRAFLFLGARYFKIDPQTQTVVGSCDSVDGTASTLGVFRDPGLMTYEALLPTFMRTSNADHFASTIPFDPCIRITKTNYRAMIHRGSRLDSIEFLQHDATGACMGVWQYVGLLHKSVFQMSCFEIPLLRDKAMRIFNAFHVESTWHDGKVLMSVLDSIPRDECFYYEEQKLAQVCLRVLRLEETQELSIFVRPDPHGLCFSVMVFLPKNRYSFQLKNQFGELLSQYYRGELASSTTQIGDYDYARIVFVLSFSTPQGPLADVREIQKILQEAALTWFDKFEAYMHTRADDEQAQALLRKYRKSFPVSYTQEFAPQEVYADIMICEHLDAEHPVDLQLYAHGTNVQVKIYHFGEALPLSRLLPMLSHLGLNATSEMTYRICVGQDAIHIHDFILQPMESVRWQEARDTIRTAFNAIWQQEIEDDGFNRLILLCGLGSRQVSMLRAYARFLLQAKLSYSQSYIEITLSEHAELVQHFVALFESRFHPTTHDLTQAEECGVVIEQYLDKVDRLDQEVILRRYYNAILATQRTNYYVDDPHTQELHSYLSFKFASSQLLDLPDPKPLYEIFVYSSTMEAIHLRGGKVARGGVRWSDRLEDYRTEVLGLLKAQMVKNSVIVPVGSKGGFVIKNLSPEMDRTTRMACVTSGYQDMIRGMLDITDNYVDGVLVSPRRVVCFDDADPYFVVAADKGTAGFSDIANQIALDYNFWLGDAFASGGSAGYHHKSMAITSRGAWESVKRHFYEMQHDVMRHPLRVVGIGDMSGDVFGNGMLRSPQIQLVAAFDHRHIFIDPTPDPARSYAERQRLFTIPRSSWDDYDRSQLSEGGGIYSRHERQITIDELARRSLGLEKTAYTPDELIRHILSAPVDLIWFGGVGTFIKASNESHADVGDTGNNAIRVDARAIRSRVIVEGANLGMTQLARIEYALHGGRINTDAIDNSAGVDCSDHEVNIKILFRSLPTTLEERNTILKDMTDDVAQLVLESNRQQNFILSVLEAEGERGLSGYQTLLKRLERHITIDRHLEFLPDDETFDLRRRKNQGMTRPELAVILSYSKLALYAQLLESAEDILAHPMFEGYLLSYFPPYLRQNYAEAILKHPLKREILATVLTNILVNRVGPGFVYDLAQTTNQSISTIVLAFFQTVELLNLKVLWQEIDDLDSQMLSPLQVESYQGLIDVLRTIVLRLAHPRAPQLDINVVRRLMKQQFSWLAGMDKETVIQRTTAFQQRGLEDNDLAQRLAMIPFLNTVVDIAGIAARQHEPLDAARAYYMIRQALELDRLYQQTHQLSIGEPWQLAAQLGLLDDIGHILMAMTVQALQEHPADSQQWLQTHADYQRIAAEMRQMWQSMSQADLGLLTYAIRQLQRLPKIQEILWAVA